MSNTTPAAVQSKFRQKKVWEVSTTHLTKEDDEKLTLCKLSDVICYPYEFGYFIHISDTRLRIKNEDGMSRAFVHLYNDALKNGVDLIQFDRDAGPENPDYPTFDW